MRLLPLIALVGVALPARAQRSAPSSPDSAAVQLIVRAATAYLSAIPQDTVRQPWRITLPSEDSALWQPVRAQLMEAVRGRVPTDSDSVRRVVTIARVHVTTDTLHAAIRIGDEHYCGGRWRGWGETHVLIALWRGTAWESPMRAVQEIIGDSVPCGTYD